MLNAADPLYAFHSLGDDSAGAASLERRWFYAHNLMESARHECEILREVMEVAQANWREAVGRLRSLEALNQALALKWHLEPEHN